MNAKTDEHGHGIAANKTAAPAPAAKTIEQQLDDARSEVDDLLTQLNKADDVVKEAQKTRSAVAKKHRSSLNKLVTLESIQRTK